MIHRKTPVIQTGIYLLKVNTRNTRARFETSSKLPIKTPERHWRHYGVFIVNSEHISFTPCSNISNVNFEHVNAG